MAFITNIDTLQFSERLQKVGLEKTIANELAEAINEVQSQSIENLATKHDIDLVRKDIDLIRNEMEILKKDIIIKLGTIMAGGVGIIAILIKF